MASPHREIFSVWAAEPKGAMSYRTGEFLSVRSNKQANKRANKQTASAVKKAQKLKKLSALQKSNLMHERDRVVEKYRKLKAGSLAKL